MDKDATITVSRGDDLYLIAKNFIQVHKLNQNLIKPIGDKIRFALNSIDKLLDCKISGEEHKSLSAIQNYYDEKNLEEDESEIFDVMDLSCITDIGSQGNYISDSLSLSIEEYKKLERLNISR